MEEPALIASAIDQVLEEKIPHELLVFRRILQEQARQEIEKAEDGEEIHRIQQQMSGKLSKLMEW